MILQSRSLLNTAVFLYVPNLDLSASTASIFFKSSRHIFWKVFSGLLKVGILWFPEQSCFQDWIISWSTRFLLSFSFFQSAALDPSAGVSLGFQTILDGMHVEGETIRSSSDVAWWWLGSYLFKYPIMSDYSHFFRWNSPSLFYPVAGSLVQVSRYVKEWQRHNCGLLFIWRLAAKAPHQIGRKSSIVESSASMSVSWPLLRAVSKAMVWINGLIFFTLKIRSGYHRAPSGEDKSCKV